MGRKSTTGGATPKGDEQIQLDFWYNGRRYRPTIRQRPTKTGLEAARHRLAGIRRRIELGTFDFAAEFPEYRFLEDLPIARPQATFSEVADAFEKSIGDLEWATRESYRKILAHFWRPLFGTRPFFELRYTDLAAKIGERAWGSNKTRNNAISVLRRVFAFGYADHPEKRDPAEKLKSLRVQRPLPDPYTVAEAEALLAAIRGRYGAATADYFEFGFFTGMRPSEIIALTWANVDLQKGLARVDRARVMGQDKGTTKTAVVRDVELCPRAAAVIHRQQARSLLAGGAVFLHEGGAPWHDLQVQWRRWAAVHRELKIRQREPYQMRHTSVTWCLMVGRNPLWVARQHGHSVAVMLKTYARWLEGSTAADIKAIEAARELVPNPVPNVPRAAHPGLLVLGRKAITG